MPLWFVCEGKDTPIESSNTRFNQTNTTLVSNCDDFAEAAEILYGPSTLLMVFMFGILVPKQITKADDLKRAVLNHYDSIYILRRVGYIAQTYNKGYSIPYVNRLMDAYTRLVMSSMCLATIVSRRQFMTHELVSGVRWLHGGCCNPFRLLQSWCGKQDMIDMYPVERESDIKDRDEVENTTIEWQLDALSAIYVEIHRLANNNSNPASHGVPLNGNTPLSAVLELTAVGQSTFDTRYLLLFFAAMTAICGFAQKLGDDGEIDMDTAWTHVMSNYVMIVFPYCLLAPFVFRKDIFKERSPYEPSSEQLEKWNDQLAAITDQAERTKFRQKYYDETNRMSLLRSKELLPALFERTARRNCNTGDSTLRRNNTNPVSFYSQHIFPPERNLFSRFSPFTKYRNSFEI
jgi:hypothetical protein